MSAALGSLPAAFARLSIESSSPKICKVPSIKIHTAHTGELVCKDKDCQKSPDRLSQVLVETATKIHSFFRKKYGLCGIFAGEITLPAIYKDLNDVNAYWDPNKMLWQFNNTFIPMEEVVVHEYTHAINNNRLFYKGQSGALDESLSDVFGLLYKRAQSKNYADWSIGNLRDASRPASLTQFPGSPNDHEVHDYSTVSTHAFFQSIERCALGPVTDDLIGHVWFQAMRQLSFEESFHSFAVKTINCSQDVEKAYRAEAATNSIECQQKQRELEKVASDIQSLVARKELFSSRKETLTASRRDIQETINSRRITVRAAQTEIDSPHTTGRERQNAKRRISYHSPKIDSASRELADLVDGIDTCDARIRRLNRQILNATFVQARLQSTVGDLETKRDANTRWAEAFEHVTLSIQNAWKSVGVFS